MFLQPKEQQITMSKEPQITMSKEQQITMSEEQPITMSNVMNSEPSGFERPTKISDELAAFLGKEVGTEMARDVVTKEINRYIKENNLNDKNGRNINADQKLAALLKINSTDELSYFNLQRYLSPHFAKVSVNNNMDAQPLSKISFNFTNIKNTFTHDISENIVMHIDIIKSVASLYFTDKTGEDINIPSGMVVYEYDFQTNKKVLLKSIRQYFVLCWTDNYTIECNNKIILDILNERKWTITSYVC